MGSSVQDEPDNSTSGSSATLSSTANMELVSRAARQHLERVALTSTRALLWLAGLSVPVCAALTRSEVRLQRNVPYSGSGHRAHMLDVYHPAQVPEGTLLPAVMYVHGGAFEACSKDTHWLMAQAYARAGFVVFNVNYRLAPEHPFPAASQDVAAAYEWVLDNARRFGADPHRLVLAGESAGANLVLGLSLMHAVPRPEPWARALFDRNIPPRAVVTACGLLEVTRPDRFADLPFWGAAVDVFRQIRSAYLPTAPEWEGEHDFANPLLLLEREAQLARPLPPFFVPCGEVDPLLDDTRRLERALAHHGVSHETRYYAGEVHGFHAMMWRESAQRCWQQTLRFLDMHLHGRAAALPAAA